MKDIPLFHAAPEEAWVLSTLNGPPGELHSAPEGKWGLTPLKMPLPSLYSA